MRDLRSYVPEASHLLQKHQHSCRAFFEDCAVVEPGADFRILASRGSGLLEGENFLTLCGLEQERESILEHLSQKTNRFLFPCQKGTVLLFGEHFGETGLLFGVLVLRDANAVLDALLWNRQLDFYVPDDVLDRVSSRQMRYDESLCAQTEELFYYIRRIFTPSADSSLWTRCLLIANFVGCRLQQVSLPTDAPALSGRDEACMTLFLLCSFLTLRQKNGKVFTEGREDKEGQETSNYRCAVSLVEEQTQVLEDFEGWEPIKKCEDLQEEAHMTEEKTLPFFLSAPCFENLSASLLEDGMRLETRFPILQKKGTLHSLGEGNRICLRFLVSLNPRRKD